jgi:predicted amidophosphoribosyltransferase
MESNYNECPCCHQDWVADTDRNCPTCDLPVSEHVSVEVLCRRVREAQQRESALLVEVIEQSRLLGMSSERECALRGKLVAERALADRLAGLLELYFWKYEVRGDIGGISKSLAAWKEARSEIRNKNNSR